MRKFKTFRTRGLSFRSLLIVAGALLLATAFVPRAHAQSVIAYFNFEDGTLGGAIDFTSDVVPGNPGGGVVLTTITTNYASGSMSSVAGLLTNRTAGDNDTANPGLGLGLRRSAGNNGTHFDIPLFASPTLFANMTVTFATTGNGNGFSTVQLFYSTNGGGTFTAGPTSSMTGPVVTLAVPVGANNAPLLVLRLVLTGGFSNGNDLQTIIDNIQVTGTIVPEPSTIAGGLLGVLGLCWFQRRRLIRFGRLRRA